MTRHVHWTMVWVVLGLLCMGVTCEPREAGLTPPRDAADSPTTFRTGYENPVIEGFARLDLSEMTVVNRDLPFSGLYVEQQSYHGPSGVSVRVDGVAADAWLDVSRAPLDLEAEFAFRGRGISLPMGGAAIPVVLESVAYDAAATDGVGTTLIAARSYALEPSVLVVPVRVTIFAAEDGTIPYLGGRATASGIVSQLFDPAGAVESRFGVRFPDGVPPFTDQLVQTRRLRDMTQARPDELFHQCGIQFHVDEVEVVAQSAGLERDLIRTENPCRASTRPGAIADYLVDPRFLGAIPVFVGGRITASLGDDTLGATCPEGNVNEFVSIDGEALLTAGIAAHELGHFLSTDNVHTSDPDSLMTPPDRGSRSIRGTRFDRCPQARCTAAQLLLEFGLLSHARRDEECDGWRAVCGNGVREAPESCDDGNNVAGDGCRPNCLVEACGDGINDPGEECDWGVASQRENCTSECTVCNACNLCGNDIVGPGEQCDDGNTTNGDGCSSGCQDEGLI